jgi:hypothetical protein
MDDLLHYMKEQGLLDDTGPRAPADSRKEAQITRNPRYMGRHCVMCFSGTKAERWTANGGCVECSRKGTGGARPSRKSPIVDARNEAKASGSRTYQGQPCVTCGNTLRMTSSTKCVVCHVKPRQPTPRQLAQQAGLTKYHARPCLKCGTTERFTSNGGCIACISGNKVPKDSPRAKALVAGFKYYEAVKPCKRCGTKQRYTANGGCKVCVNNATDKYREARASVYHHTTQAVMWVNEPPSEAVAHLYAKLPFTTTGWSLRYTDAKGVGVKGRLKTGKDALEFPEDLAWLSNTMMMDKTLKGGHYDIIPHIRPVLREAMQLYMSVRSEKFDGREANHKRNK